MIMFKAELNWREVLVGLFFSLLAVVIAGLVVMGDYVADFVLQYIH